MNEQSSEAVSAVWDEKSHFTITREMRACLWPTGQIHGWDQSLLINYNLFPLTEELPSIITDLTPHLSMTNRHMSPLILLLTPPPTSIPPPPCWRHAATIWVTVSTPVFAPAPVPGPPALDAAPGPEEELQSSAVLWGGGLWGGLSWAASGPGPERSQHAQRAGACMHLSTQGLRWEPAGCT